MSTGAHSDSTILLLVSVCVSRQRIAIHPSCGERLQRNYMYIWQQAIPMSPSKQATKGCRSKQRNSLSSGKQRKQWLQVLRYWVIIWSWLHFPETCFSLSQPLVDRWHMDIFMLLTILPEDTALFFSPAGLGVVPGSAVDSSDPSCLLSSLALHCVLTLCGRTSGATLPTSKL